MRHRGQPFWDKVDGAGGGADPAVDAPGGQPTEDDGFTIESASVPFTQAPEDTTLGAEEPPVKEPAQAAAVVARTDGEDSASAAAVSVGADAGADGSAAVAAPPKGTKAARKPSERVAELRHEIDALTHTKHRTVEETRELEAKRETLRAEIVDLDKKKAAAAGTSPAPKAAAEDTEPEHPKYRDFGTDEEYETAVATWKTNHRGWSDRRLEALKKDITDGVEARFTSADQDVAQRTAMSTMVQTLTKVSAGLPDWDEKADALSAVRSSWFDPTRHIGADGKPVYAPFLADLAQTLMMDGAEEGATLLHWLGTDPDRAQRLADLQPNKFVRDAIVHAPSVTPLLDFFASEEGAAEFERLNQMHPLRMNQALGALSLRLQPAPRGSGAAAHPVTQARPSARPPVGSPGARVDPARQGASESQYQGIPGWMLDDETKDVQTSAKERGVTLTPDDARGIAYKRLVG